MADVKNKREQVKECIELGTMTKADMVEKLGMSSGSVSTQMTYLRWMGHFILPEPETKILKFTDKETYEAHVADKKANAKTPKGAARTPAERAVAVAKTITNQEASKVKWDAKIVECEEILTELPDDADAELNLKEAIASVALAEVKIARNTSLALTLPDLETATAEVEAAAAEKAADEAVENVEDEQDEVAEGESTEELL